MATRIFPHGRIAMDNGDLIDVTNVKHDVGNNAKQVHTLRQKGSGIVLGVEETTVSFDAVVSEEGFERDYLKALKKGTIKQIRIKVPGETITVEGTVSKRSLEVPLDDAIKYTIEFIGHTED